MNVPFDQEIIIENERALLQPIQRLADAEPLWPINKANPMLMQYSPAMIKDRDSFEMYFESALQLKTVQSKYPFIIRDKLNKEAAGSTSFMNIDVGNERLEIGSTYFGPQFHRTGLNRNVKLLMLTYAFERLNVKRVELKTDARNTQSRTAILGIGAQYEGSLRSHTIMIDGYRRDTVYYSILAHEWSEIKSRLILKIK
jgi:RimJ/RimL family protein N-acetyltransferase